MKKSNGNFKLGKVAVEAASIVLAVLLALAVDEWRENRSQQQQAHAALMNISIELKYNQKVLKLIHENNVETVKVMVEDQASTGESEQDEDRNFIPGLQLRETAWETLLSTGISGYVDYDTILDLSATYSMQRVYKDAGSQMAAAAMNIAAYATVLDREVDNESFQRQFINHFEMLVGIEESLLESYQLSISRLDESVGGYK